MKLKIRIIIVGIGGVGGYFGGLLAKQYRNSEDVEIVFVARGKHLKQIQLKGLIVFKGTVSFTANPHLATDDFATVGKADFIILCTKSYDLESTIEQMKPCVGKNTFILPLLNVVDSEERIKLILPNSNVLQGCVYIISRLKQAGIVENIGNIQTLYFGGQEEYNQSLQLLNALLINANIEATLSADITSVIWEKFIFISPTATATSYFDCNIGKLIEQHEAEVLQLVNEVKSVAMAKKIHIDTDIITKTIAKLKALPYETTSSMHSDFQTNRQHTELQSLTGYVLTAAKRLKIGAPTYDKMFQKLTKKNGT